MVIAQYQIAKECCICGSFHGGGISVLVCILVKISSWCFIWVGTHLMKKLGSILALKILA